MISPKDFNILPMEGVAGKHTVIDDYWHDYPFCDAIALFSLVLRLCSVTD